MVEQHCDAARFLAQRLEKIDGISLRNEVHLNQLAIAFMEPGGNCSSAELAAEMAERLNAKGDYFLRTATWNEATVLRISVIAYGTDMAIVDRLARDMIAQRYEANL